MWKTVPGLGNEAKRRLVAGRGVTIAASFAALLIAVASAAPAADYQQALESYLGGKYGECVQACQEAIESGEWNENWRLLKIQAEAAQGLYLPALETLDAALKRYSTSPRLRWLGIQLLRQTGFTAEADRLRTELARLIQQYPYIYSDAAARVAVGRFLLAEGAEPRQVLEIFFDQAKKSRPDLVDPYLAAGQLALEKHDYRVAAQEFRKALQIAPEHPDALFGLVEALAPSQPEAAEEFLERLLNRNPSYVPALLWMAERHIDAERYEEAEKLLEEVEKVNPECAELWALRAVVAHLNAQHDAEGFFRRVALGWWPLNPRVDWLIGKKLSQHYRFADGAEHQRRALKMDPDYLPAQFQLALDLMRLGAPEGWQLIAEVFRKDPYNVVAHNLVKLSERLETFRTIEQGALRIRMDKSEAEVYGDEVRQLLERAHEELAGKYEVVFSEPVIIEIFPEQADFAIRTFGLPGGEGFLGVCFGRVITANSPAAQGASPSNWQSVLWHEFCHAVTLHKTRNKMPRWLSEGISVYEERQAGRSWGQRMNPEYRKRILSGELTPIAQMNTAFLQPESPADLQFAYYQASLVVEFLVERFGHRAVLLVLDELGNGVPINEALQRHTAGLEELDQQFRDYARRMAENYGAGVDWSEPDERVRADRDRLQEWMERHGESWFAVKEKARRLIAEQQWQEARQLLEPWLDRCPDYVAGDSPAALYATACRALGDSAGERRGLERIAEHRDDALDVYIRLMELARADGNWPAFYQQLQRALAVQPVRSDLQEWRAEAARKLGLPHEEVAALRALLAMEPGDPAQLHFELAQRYRELGDAARAKRHALQALEEAPRFRAAQRLLWELVREESDKLPDGTRDRSQSTGDNLP
ncbi:MAG: hypothetical protein KatS3mg110_2042 [Pirellulaceae bacterium]|nr:MAG: hypothetical protein KatS3mg110_2042 [Pirellulaceae bacterium]